MTGRRVLRAWATACISVTVLVGLAGCGDDVQGDTDLAGPRSASGAISDTFELPFDMTQPAGLVPIGRPAIYADEVDYDGVPYHEESLWAAYRVTGDDPLGTARAWLSELDSLALDEVSIHGASEGNGALDHQPWLSIWGVSSHDDYPHRDWVDMGLWVTGDEPILLVAIARMGDLSATVPPTVDDDGDRSPPPPSSVDDRPRTGGDHLFTEQGSEMRLPDDSWSLMPTLPTSQGTGGSTTLLAAPDAARAVQDLLDQAEALSDDGEIDGPDVQGKDGTRIVTANFNISAGGWGFTVVAAQAPDDPYATVYIRSYAD